MKKFWIALQFLTVLPVRMKEPFKEEDFKGLLSLFPAVGACIGVVPALVAACCTFLPHLALVALALAILTVITGALHIDGLADTCDGLFSGQPKDRMLEIMRDSRIGTFGAVGVCLLLLLKFAFLAGLPQDLLWKIFILMPVFARWIQSVACASCAYARTGGKAELFFKHAGIRDVVVGGVFSLALFQVFLGIPGIVLFGAAMLPAMLFIRFADRKLQGMTGDTVGAASEIAELSVLFFSVGFLR
ncbi:MAG: adenosylcobinamide-GDP ribazoletransferase [Candidatus Omnitrophica bacterium]|nr:adenosylcobinamide-GDP ribazoletransferase [Candidatus Omnitrophota bacterium]